MFEIDRDRFGAFVAALRRDRGMTQKDLAGRLAVTDKAVSKWERGQGLPDVTLLEPLAQARGVTVTELLECRRMEPETPVSVQDAEALVRRVIDLSGEETARGGPDRKKWGVRYGLCLALALSLPGANLLHLGNRDFADLRLRHACQIANGIILPAP